MSTFSLDADTVTKLLKKHPGNLAVVQRFREEARRNALFIACPVVYYEIRRELVLKQANAQLATLEKLIDAVFWREFNARIWNRAAGLWSALRAQGKSHNDADVLIAAHALEYDAVLVTGNVEHFRDTGVQLEDWSE